MSDKFIKEEFLKKHIGIEEDISRNKISFEDLREIYKDFNDYKGTYEAQADFIANTLRTHKEVHSVKSRVKKP